MLEYKFGYVGCQNTWVIHAGLSWQYQGIFGSMSRVKDASGKSILYVGKHVGKCMICVYVSKRKRRDITHVPHVEIETMECILLTLSGGVYLCLESMIGCWENISSWI